ncbi:MAG: nitroreductase family protein [Firmicutes bacterium]|nr:nitroreductase family protein [Bacillota bacterium]
MVLEHILTRRSTRKFKSTPVTKEQTHALLEAAMRSPSACNTRPWRFIAITNRDLLDDLAEIHPWAKMMLTAQLCIVIVALPKSQEGIQNGLAEGFWPQDCGAATENIIIQAEALGLGSCWCGIYPRQETVDTMTELLGTAPDEIPFCLIAIGEKDEFPDPRGTYDEEKVTWVE